jgi:hypothetical protein
VAGHRGRAPAPFLAPRQAKGCELDDTIVVCLQIQTTITLFGSELAKLEFRASATPSQTASEGSLVLFNSCTGVEYPLRPR